VFNFKEIKPIHIILLGIAISIGPGMGGFFIGKAIDRFKASGKSVSVKGLSERIVDADTSFICVIITEKTDDPSITTKSIKEDAKKLKEILKDAGFNIDSIAESIKIKEAPMPYSPNLFEKTVYKKYNYTLALELNGFDVSSAQKFQSKLLNLNTSGQLLNVETEIIYTYADLEKIRAPMLAEATKSARAMADQFAKDSDTKVGGILNATQGSFSITGAKDTSSNEHYSYDTPSSFKKRVRVVSNITFRLE
jgi:hypothetical protein